MKKESSATALFEFFEDTFNSQQGQLHASEQLRKTNPLNLGENRNWRKESDRINEEGAQRFGWDWVRANESAIAAADLFGVDYQNQQIRAFMQSIVFAALDRVNKNIA